MTWARLVGVAGLIVMLAAGAASGDTREVSADELVRLLIGNSIDGHWGDTHYIQYFGESGRTLYKANGSPGEWGTWRINDEGQYCSSWRGGDEICYLVIDMDGAFYWRSLDGSKTYPFEIIDGDITIEGDFSTDDDLIVGQ